MCFQAQPEVEVVIGPECITEMHATKDTDCRGSDVDHITCKRITITYKPSCVHINVVPKDSLRIDKPDSNVVSK